VKVNLDVACQPPAYQLSLTHGFLLALALLVVASFATLDLQWAQFFSATAFQKMGRFAGELFSPNLHPAFLRKLGWATLETLAMSALGTLLAAMFGLLLVRMPITARVLRSIPELIWATLLLIAAGLGPMAGTLALALHTAGVLARLFAQAMENAPQDANFALRLRGKADGGQGRMPIFFYATLPLLITQFISYTLYRWENNIRAAAVLGVVGAGGLGAMLSFHLSLFQMHETSSVLAAMLLLVVVVDGASFAIRRVMTR
jgi:phosphonate transport system permease protein